MRPAEAARALLLACALVPTLAGAGDWPDRPIRLVVPVPPGGQPDTAARILAAPDGTTVLLALTSLVINPLLQPSAADPGRDLAPVARIARTQFVLVAAPTMSLSDVPQLISHSKSNSRGVTCAHSGGVTQIACGLLGALGGVAVVAVPFRGNTQAAMSVMRGEVDLLFDGVAAAYANARAGRVKALARTDPTLGAEPFERLPAMRDALPGFDLGSWQGVVAPAATPRVIVERLGAEIVRVLANEAVRKRMRDAGLQPAPATPGEFAEFLNEERERYARLMCAAGIRSE
jgi:tripartite-type tricarboxylate transporter receptor subunit TctC